jgi:hypothetical protein
METYDGRGMLNFSLENRVKKNFAKEVIPKG